MTDLGELWATCSANLRKQVPEPTWNAWLAPLVLVEARGSSFVIAAPNSLVRERVATRFQTLIEASLADGSGNVSTDVEIIVKAPPPQTLFATEDEPVRGQTDLGFPEPEEPAPVLPADPEQLDLGQGRSSASASRSNRRSQTMLNPRYTFEAFVIGASNRFAHAAARPRR